MSDKPLVDGEYLLDKFPETGGWTYTVIPEIPPDPHAPFGWVRVKGSIDGVEIRDYRLMPTAHGTGRLFLSVKAEIRKKIKKAAGDTVRIILHRDDDPPEVPEELLLCLGDDARAMEFFLSLRVSEQQAYVRWIYSAKTERTREERIAKTVTSLSEGRKFTRSSKP